MVKSKYWKYIDGKELVKVKYSINFSSLNFKQFSDTKESEILAAVAHAYNIDILQMYSKSRKRKFVEPRHMSMFLMRETLGLSLSLIARKFRCHHATVLHACRSIKDLISTNLEVWQKYCDIETEKPYIKPANPLIKDELGTNEKKNK